jgi:signal transduction histidine kinase
MASAVSEFDLDQAALADSIPARVFHWAVSAIALFGVGGLILAEAARLDAAEIGAWVLAALLADLMCVRIGKSVTLSMSLPVLLAAGFAHVPGVAGLIAFLGCLDPRELQGKLPIERIVFNRSQIALSTAAAGGVMQVLASTGLRWPIIMLIFGVGLATDCIVNVAFVVVSTVLSGRANLRDALADLWGTEPAASFALYASMSLVAPLFLLIYREWGPWALLACTSLLFPFRLALTRIEKLGATYRIVRIREAALADAEAVMTTQSHEERLLLAGDLHDEVLPALYKVHLMGEVLRQDLASGRLLDLDDDLPELLDATNAAQHAIRRVMGDLRTARSAIRNVARAIRSCADQLQDEGRPRIELRLIEVQVDEPIALCLLQVAREAMVNASRYSNARRITVELTLDEDAQSIQMSIDDDGDGFDESSVDEASHFGLQLMRERVQSVGGRLSIASSRGLGTLISAELPPTVKNIGDNETTPPTSRGG